MNQLEPAHTICETAQNRAPEYFAMAVCAVLLRLLLLLATMKVFHKSFDAMARVGDGHSYIFYARTLAGARGILTDYDRRVFFGYPLVIAGFHCLGMPWNLAAMGTSWLAAAVACVLATFLTGSRRIGWAMVGLTPHYLLYTSVAMNEAVLLAFCLGGLVVAMKGLDEDRPARDPRRWMFPLIGGLLLGYAGLVRPFACFAVLGFLIHAARKREWTAAVIVAVAAAGVVGAGALGLYLATGDALQGVKAYRDNPQAYRGDLYTLPFKSLIYRSLYGHVAMAKVIYVWVYVAVDLTAVAILARRWLRDFNHRLDRTDLFCIWLAGNTMAILCVGSIWGFEAFHRFSAWALPAELFALTPILPRRVWTWLSVTGISFAIALYSINRN